MIIRVIEFLNIVINHEFPVERAQSKQRKYKTHRFKFSDPDFLLVALASHVVELDLQLVDLVLRVDEARVGRVCQPARGRPLSFTHYPLP